MNINEFFQENRVWLIEIAIGFCAIIFFSLLFQKIISVWHSRVSKSDNFWKKKIQPIFRTPVLIAVWGVGLAYLLEVIILQFDLDVIFPYISALQGAVIILCISWIILRWMKEGFNHLAQKSEKMGISSATLYTLNKFSTIVILILTLLILFPLFGLSILPLVTFGGIAMAGIAFAAQDMIANFFGGIMLHSTRIFFIGDYIFIPKENFEGTVKEIGWYTTLIEDAEHRMVFFPNGLFFKSGIINDSRRSHRRILTTLTIRYADFSNLEKIINEIGEKIKTHPEVDNTQGNSSNFSNFGAYGLEITVSIYLYRMGYGKFLIVKQEILLLINEVMRKYGAEFCYPTTNVNLRQFPSQ